MKNSILTSGKLGNVAYDTNKLIREEIQKRWDGIGFTAGLDGYLKENMAILFENEAKHLMTEATASDNSGSFETVVFPIIRRTFAKLLANDIVSVQAMNLPIGKLFFLKPVTSERKWEMENGDAVGDEIVGGEVGKHYGLMGYEREERNGSVAQSNRYYLPDEVVNEIAYSVFDNRGNVVLDGVSFDEAKAAADADASYVIRQVSPQVTQYMKKTLYDLFYNDFLYDNSKGKIHINVGTATPVVFNFKGELVDLASGATFPVYGADGSVRNIILKVGGFSSVNPGRLTGPDGNEMDTEEFLASLKVIAAEDIPASSGDTSSFRKGEGIQFRLVTQRYGKGMVEYADVCDADGHIYIELDLAKPVRKQGQTIDGFIGVAPDAVSMNSFKIAWAQYDSLELETEMGEVSFQLDSVTVSVTERKLRATWSPELAQDVSAFHNIDAEAELTAILSEQIGAEIDREILRDLRKLAPWQLAWDYNGWRRTAGYSTNYTQKDWNQTLITKINQISAQIMKATLRGGVNFIVVSAELSAVFNDLEYFHVTDASAEQDSYNMGIERIGSLSGRYQVYVDPYAPHWSMILGHKGKSLLDTGYIYAPYVPMQLTPTMYNPFNFAPVKGIMTRYAKKMVNNRFYGAVKATGLQTFDIRELR